MRFIQSRAALVCLIVVCLQMKGITMRLVQPESHQHQQKFDVGYDSEELKSHNNEDQLEGSSLNNLPSDSHNYETETVNHHHRQSNSQHHLTGTSERETFHKPLPPNAKTLFTLKKNSKDSETAQSRLMKHQLRSRRSPLDTIKFQQNLRNMIKRVMTSDDSDDVTQMEEQLILAEPLAMEMSNHWDQLQKQKRFLFSNTKSSEVSRRQAPNIRGRIDPAMRYMGIGKRMAVIE